MVERADEVLIAILAATDAVWIPDREIGNTSRHTLIYERRRDFWFDGVNYGSLLVNTSAADRKQTERAIRELTNDGLVTLFKGKSQVTSARLTHSGDERARAICGLSTLADGLKMLARMASFNDSPLARDGIGRIYTPSGRDSRWLVFHHEMVLLNEPAERDECEGFRYWQERMFFPLACRSLAISCADHSGSVWYASVPGIATPNPLLQLPDQIDGAFELWDDMFTNALNRRRAEKPAYPNELGELPMSGGTARAGSAQAWEAFKKGGLTAAR